MRLLLDENQPHSLRGHLRDHGHDATAVGIDDPHALRDSEILSLSLREDRLLITLDTDFGELVFRRGMPHRGVTLLRLRDERPPFIRRWVDYLLATIPDRLHEFIVVTEVGIRIRSVAPPDGGNREN